jgi:hypothetical protein
VVGACVVGAAGVVALTAVLLYRSIGGSWVTVGEVARIAMTAAIPFLMLAFWELGGLTPTPLARLAQITGWLAAGAWCATHVLFVLGVVDLDYAMPATGAYAVEAVALIVIGLWIAGANLLAGPWLNAFRWYGVLAGLGVVMFALGTLVGSKDSALFYVGGVFYLAVLPLWALGMAFYLVRMKSVITAQ